MTSSSMARATATGSRPPAPADEWQSEQVAGLAEPSVGCVEADRRRRPKAL